MYNSRNDVASRSGQLSQPKPLYMEPLSRPTPSFGMREKTYTSSSTDSIYKPFRPEYATPEFGRRNELDAAGVKEKEIFGRRIRRRVFWGCVVGGVVLVLGAVGTGVGVGVSRKNEAITKAEGKSPVSAIGLASPAHSTPSPTPTLIAITTIMPSSTSTPISSSSTITSKSTLKSSPSSSSSASTSTKSTPTPTPTPTTTSPTSFPTTGLLSLDCPSINSQTYQSTSTSTTYLQHCNGTNYVSNVAAITGYNTTSIDKCMDKCTLFNGADPQIACAGITWQGNVTEAMKKGQGANCWLASTAGVNKKKLNTGSFVASAEVVDG